MVVHLTQLLPSPHLVPYFVDSRFRSMVDPIGRSLVPAIGEGAGVGGTPAPLGGKGRLRQPVEYYWVPGWTSSGGDRWQNGAYLYVCVF